MIEALRERRRFRREAVVVLLLAAFLFSMPTMLSACGRIDRAGAADAAGPRPDVLILVLDALRADRLGCYGYERATSPVLDTVAADQDAVVYKNHYVQGAYTKPSTASLFSGLFVFQHGVIYGHEMVEIPGRPGFYPTQRLGDEVDTMAERFDRLGYRTFGIVKSHHLDAEYGFAQGFDHYVDARLRGDRQRMARTIDLMLAGPGPVFGYIHLNGVHHPYPPQHRDQSFMTQYGYDEDFLYHEQTRMAQGVDFTTAEIRHAILDGDVTLEPDDVRFLDLIYDAKLRMIDQMLEPFIRFLKETGRYDNTMLIVTADHGEELYDHESYGHGHALWDEIIRVPLIVKFPRGWKPDSLGREVEATTQAVDLLPALMGLIGQPADGRLPGTDIFLETPRGFAFCETHLEWALLQDGYKLIDGGEQPFLFEQRSDSGNRVNLSESEPERVASMRDTATALRQLVAIKPLQAPLEETQLSEDAVRSLRALGYVR